PVAGEASPEALGRVPGLALFGGRRAFGEPRAEPGRPRRRLDGSEPCRKDWPEREVVRDCDRPDRQDATIERKRDAYSLLPLCACVLHREPLRHWRLRSDPARGGGEQCARG